MLDLYSTAVNYQQQQRQRSHTKDHSASSRHQPTSTTENRRPSRLETVPTLPTIVTSSYINDSSASSFDREQPAVLVSPTMDTTQTRSIEFLLLNNSTGRKLNPILIPSTSWRREKLALNENTKDQVQSKRQFLTYLTDYLVYFAYEDYLYPCYDALSSILVRKYPNSFA